MFLRVFFVDGFLKTIFEFELTLAGSTRTGSVYSYILIFDIQYGIRIPAFRLRTLIKRPRLYGGGFDDMLSSSPQDIASMKEFQLDLRNLSIRIIKSL